MRKIIKKILRHPVYYSILGVLIACLLWGIGVSIILACGIKVGDFGDSYGALNTLFSGLAFAGVIFTIWEQRRIVRQELEEQRRLVQLELKEQRILNEEQKLNAAMFEYLKAIKDSIPPSKTLSINLTRIQIYLNDASVKKTMLNEDYLLHRGWMHIFVGWTKKVESSGVRFPHQYIEELWNMIDSACRILALYYVALFDKENMTCFMITENDITTIGVIMDREDTEE